ncbi:DNA-binding transcriptional regulator, LysR family [Tistlia consotensis]|uniref:DNA-binding transcriptional regulator, LysR family n=1 Tax=Tistlia consotensis USBA 355 TaxID=560819 RepID=A0A1Y6B877_9PROT|nr:LysR family transcriptional regulator [Tistlia consotensis]SME97971.1 DNA-binding transcriptional regulator, LysR family [Tistlia consotensis USBA 355]SNR57355.1 DNA-binding transcriptional regulator, LysR family [Tistlia consotensis]
MQDHLAAMAVFAQVVESGGFSLAGRQLGLSKSAVSKAVARLEDHLGTRLINRTTRKLSLTEAGRSFYEGCRRMLAEAEAAERAVTHLTDAPRGVLRLNAPMSFGVRHLSPCLGEFMGGYPELEIDLTLEDRRVDLVEEGYDLAIRIGVMPDSSLVARRLGPNPRVICAAPAYLERRGVPTRPEALSGHDCLLYHYQTSGDSWRLRPRRAPDGSGGGEVTVRVKGRLKVNNGDSLREAALAGLGIAHLPAFIICEDLDAGRLVPLLEDYDDVADGGVYAVYPASRNLSPKVRVFIDFLAERFQRRPYWRDGA